MTEVEWLACADPRLSLIFLENISSPRKARLFACAVGRSLWPYLGDERHHLVVEVAERHADNLTTEIELQAARSAALDGIRGWAGRIAMCAADKWAWQAARTTMMCLKNAQTERVSRELAKRTASLSRQFLMCIFGNPFRSVTVDESFLTTDVLALAGLMYESRDFSPMPILADALQEAGCENDEILAHCRVKGPHVRGCFLVDLLLGKE